MRAAKTLEELRAMPSGLDRIKAIAIYVEQGEEKLKDARRLRNDDLRALAAEIGQSEAARQAGVSLSTVKIAVGQG